VVFKSFRNSVPSHIFLFFSHFFLMLGRGLPNVLRGRALSYLPAPPPPEFLTALDRNFRGSLRISSYVSAARAAAAAGGIPPHLALLATSFCRDSLLAPLRTLIKDWGWAFDLAALSGMPSAGPTGFKALRTQAPSSSDGRSRFVFFGASHIGLGPGGEVGMVLRPRRDGTDFACASLRAAHSKVKAGLLDYELDVADLEQSGLVKILGRELGGEPVPDHVDFTKLASRAICSRLEGLIEGSLNPATDLGL